MESLTVPAPAKINLALDVGQRRPDGYHRVSMIMQSISLYDKIVLTRAGQGITLNSTESDLPDGPSNLAYQAAEAVFQKTGISGGIDIYLEKNIPVAAGLAGGSADAAAVIRGLNRLYDLGLEYRQLHLLAADLGADVPFCLQGGTVLARGIGDQLTYLPDLQLQQILLVVPPVAVSTEDIYQAYDQFHPDFNIPIEHLVQIIKQGKSLALSQGWANKLEAVTSRLVKDIDQIKGILYDSGQDFVLMSGSGPAVFAILDGEISGEHLAENWPRPGDLVFNLKTVGRRFPELTDDIEEKG